MNISGKKETTPRKNWYYCRICAVILVFAMFFTSTVEAADLTSKGNAGMDGHQENTSLIPSTIESTVREDGKYLDVQMELERSNKYESIKNERLSGNNTESKSISEANVSLPETEYVYSGYAIEPVPTVSVDGIELTENNDYEIFYDNNIDAGTGTITIRGKGNYGGETKATFSILPCDITTKNDGNYETKNPSLITDSKLKSEGNGYKLDLKRHDVYVIKATEVYQTPVWSSKKREVAFVDENGTIYARQPGKTVISTKINGKTIKILITVAKNEVDPDGDSQAYLGIGGVDVNSETSKKYNIPEGLYIAQVETGSAAEKAGLILGDVIVKMAGESVDSMEKTKEILKHYKPGDVIEIVVKKGADDYKEETISVTLQKKSEG